MYQKKNHNSHMYSNVWYLSIFLIYLNSNTFIQKQKNKITSSKTNPLPHVKITHSYPVFECLIPISIGYLFEFKYFWWCCNITSEQHNPRSLPLTTCKKKKWSCRGHRCGVDQIPSDGQIRTVLNSRVLERVNYAYLDLREYWSFYSRRKSASLPWTRSLFLMGLFL